jgi:carbamoyltransferase
MKILGLNFGHDSGACLIVNGILISAINEERLSRIKMHCGFPFRSIDEVLSIGNYKLSDIDLICVEGKMIAPIESVNFNITHEANNLRKTFLAYTGFEKYILGTKSGLFITALIMLPSTIKKRLKLKKYLLNNGFKGQIRYFDHHECHAATAYFSQIHKEGLAITLDASGEGICSRVYRCLNNSMELIHTIPCYHSPAYYYAYITEILGYKPLRHEGKITGLAAFGSPEKVKELLKEYIYYDESKLTFQNIGGYHLKVFKSLSAKISNFSKEDIAAGIQSYTEELITNYVRSIICHFNNGNPTNIMLAGGIFANVKVNAKINDLALVKSTYIFPNMGDGGLALGAALAHLRRFITIPSMYLGRDFRDSQIEFLLKKYNLTYIKSKSISKDIALKLFQRKIVARFAGRMEYGPRALGNRSILYSSSDKSVNKWLNEQLSRTEFMPFAPVVRDVDATKFFKIEKHSDSYSYMTMTCEVTDYCKLIAPATTHIDGTARPQIIIYDNNPSYYDILTEYSRLSCVPAILVNTSFNLHEEPIVNSPEEAINTFLTSKLDYLALEDYLISNN